MRRYNANLNSRERSVQNALCLNVSRLCGLRPGERAASNSDYHDVTQANAGETEAEAMLEDGGGTEKRESERSNQLRGKPPSGELDGERFLKSRIRERFVRYERRTNAAQFVLRTSTE